MNRTVCPVDVHRVSAACPQPIADMQSIARAGVISINVRILTIFAKKSFRAKIFLDFSKIKDATLYHKWDTLASLSHPRLCYFVAFGDILILEAQRIHRRARGK